MYYSKLILLVTSLVVKRDRSLRISFMELADVIVGMLASSIFIAQSGRPGTWTRTAPRVLNLMSSASL
jgi:hypothetical protein